MVLLCSVVLIIATFMLGNDNVMLTKKIIFFSKIRIRNLVDK